MHPSQSSAVPSWRARDWVRVATRMYSVSWTPPSRDASPLHLAIVGSGPAGFYTAARVMSRLANAQVDMYETLPVPYGLVRYGVAPDHPEVKNCKARFEDVAMSPNFRFIGNVSIGNLAYSAEHCAVPLETLMRHYDSVLMAYGASEEKPLGIPGESTLRGIFSARQFVGWYNGHPDCADLRPDLTCGEDAVIIGQGNVALDIARILLQHIDVLSKTDIAEYALAQLIRSRIRKVRVVGRRGLMQAAFTIKEARELMTLPGVAFFPIERSRVPDHLGSLPRASRRLMELLLRGSATSTAFRSWSLESCLSPTRFLGHSYEASVVSRTEFEVMNLAAPFHAQSQSLATGETRLLPSDIVLRSVGYKSTPIPGFAEAGIQFDDGKGVLKNDGFGRVIRNVTPDSAVDPRAGIEQVAGVYCAGWVKTGGKGIIATTMQDAFATGDAIVQDWVSGARLLRSDEGNRAGGWEAIKTETGLDFKSSVSWDQWLKIDSAEKARGQKDGKPREKFTNTGAMLSVIG